MIRIIIRIIIRIRIMKEASKWFPNVFVMH
jgi:hypothetical protein